jgi:hypothetical protein
LPLIGQSRPFGKSLANLSDLLGAIKRELETRRSAKRPGNLLKQNTPHAERESLNAQGSVQYVFVLLLY